MNLKALKLQLLEAEGHHQWCNWRLNVWFFSSDL